MTASHKTQPSGVFGTRLVIGNENKVTHECDVKFEFIETRGYGVPGAMVNIITVLCELRYDDIAVPVEISFNSEDERNAILSSSAAAKEILEPMIADQCEFMKIRFI